MTIKECHGLAERAMQELLQQVNRRRFGEMNEATLQHHLALNLHLDTLQAGRPNIDMMLEKKVKRAEGIFPKKNSKTASIDIFFHQDDETKYAIELKCFRKANHREPNNRYEAYADLANLEIYLEEHTDAGIFLLVTDHPHYFDNSFRPHSAKASDFSLRDGHRYEAGRVLSYKTSKPHGADLTLRKGYNFNWQNQAHA
ncbi:MAG: hypothetical protein ACI80I_003183, partial [Akkermansiaceae bacterium]